MQSVVRTTAFQAVSPVSRRALVIQNAHKQGAGSTKNGRQGLSDTCCQLFGSASTARVHQPQDCNADGGHFNMRVCLF